MRLSLPARHSDRDGAYPLVPVHPLQPGWRPPPLAPLPVVGCVRGASRRAYLAFRLLVHLLVSSLPLSVTCASATTITRATISLARPASHMVSLVSHHASWPSAMNLPSHVRNLVAAKRLRLSVRSSKRAGGREMRSGHLSATGKSVRSRAHRQLRTVNASSRTRVNATTIAASPSTAPTTARTLTSYARFQFIQAAWA